MKKPITLLISLIFILQCCFIATAGNEYSVGTYKVTASSLRVRTQATTSSSQVTSTQGSPMYLSEGEVVYVSKINNNWGYIENVDEISGWICLDYTESIDLSDGTPFDGNTDTDIKKPVIDVSVWNGYIDWQSVAADGIWGSIIRIGRTSSATPDITFDYNYWNAVANGIQTGCYYYSYAKTVAKAKEDAEKVIKFLKSRNYKMTLPIYYDMEDPYIESLSNSLLTDITYTFCKTLKDAGYTAGVYCNRNWATKKLDMSRLSEFEVWIAEWNSTCLYTGSYGMWQYSDKGNVKGITESVVDLDWCYKNYPYLIRLNNQNGLKLDIQETETTTTKTETETTTIPSIINGTAVNPKIETTPVTNVKCTDGTDNHTVTDWEVIAQPDDSGNSGTKRGVCSVCGKTVYMFFTSSELQTDIIIGDIDLNGKVTAQDARLLLRYTAKLDTFDDNQKNRADVDKDGKISVQDARLLLRASAKLETI